MTTTRVRRLSPAEADVEAGHASRLLSRLAMTAMLVLGAWASWQALVVERGDERVVQTVELLGPPPPAPEELEPEPPLETEAETVEVPEVEMAQPGPEAAEPGDDRLGLDADAGGGSDAFGLLAKKGGREITSLGGSGDGAGGGSGLLLQAFVGSLRAEIQRELNAHLDLRRRSYVAIVKIWVADDGRIQRFEVSDPTGQPDIDEALERALAQLGRVADPPPGIPQPIWLRVRSSQLTEAASR